MDLRSSRVDYKEWLWRVAFGFRALIFLRRHFSVCRGRQGTPRAGKISTMA
jgi:hypothetical protein